VRQRRALLRAVRARPGLARKDELRVETARGVIRPRIEASGQVTVTWPAAVRARGDPFQHPGRAPDLRARGGRRAIALSVLSMGNPHAVQVVADIDCAPGHDPGPAHRAPPAFPTRVNAGYLQVLARGPHPSARLGARRRRNARLRHGRVRRRRRGRPPRAPRPRGARDHARRRPHDPVGRLGGRHDASRRSVYDDGRCGARLRGEIELRRTAPGDPSC